MAAVMQLSWIASSPIGRLAMAALDQPKQQALGTRRQRLVDLGFED
jgi:hypothetical protein